MTSQLTKVGKKALVFALVSEEAIIKVPRNNRTDRKKASGMKWGVLQPTVIGTPPKCEQLLTGMALQLMLATLRLEKSNVSLLTVGK